jgi:hypothetical protein
MEVISIGNIPQISTIHIWVMEDPVRPGAQFNVMGLNTSELNEYGSSSMSYRLLPSNASINTYDPVTQSFRIELDQIYSGYVVYNI